MANDFNDVLAMDLKFITISNKQHIILHMIDIFTRYSAASVIRSKDKEVIVDAILRHWISVFGKPATIYSDNGGEFNNKLLRDVAELYLIVESLQQQHIHRGRTALWSATML